MRVDQESTRFRTKTYRNREKSEKRRFVCAGRTEVSKSGKNDNDRGIYRMTKEERAGSSIGQPVRSDSSPFGWLFDRLGA